MVIAPGCIIIIISVSHWVLKVIIAINIMHTESMGHERYVCSQKLEVILCLVNI